MKLFRVLKWIIIGTFLILAISSYRFSSNLSTIIKNCYTYMAYPFFKIQGVIVDPFIQLVQSFKEQRAAISRIKVLEEENMGMRARLIELQASIDYSADIQELAEYRRQFDELSGRIVKIVSRHLSEQEQTLLVDYGALHGIQPDMVVVNKNCLIGRVSEVYPLYSKVVLITDTSCKVAAYCKQTKATGIHVGENSTETSLQRVDHLSTLELSDEVISSGEGLVFPHGFLIGHIKDICYNGIYQIARIKPAVDVASIKYCIILQRGMPQVLTPIATRVLSES